MKPVVYQMQANILLHPGEEPMAFNDAIIARFHHEPYGGVWLSLEGQNTEHELDPAWGLSPYAVMIDSEEELDELYKVLKKLFKQHPKGDSNGSGND